MSACPICGVGFPLPSGRCDHCDNAIVPTATPPTEQATAGEINAPTTEAWMKRITTTAPAVAQGEAPHEVACRLLNESDPNNVDKWREVNAVEAIITPLVRELNEAKAQLAAEREAKDAACRGWHDQRTAREAEQLALAAERSMNCTLRQQLAQVEKERDEALKARDVMNEINKCDVVEKRQLRAELAELRKDRDGSGLRNDLAITEGELKKYRDRLAFLGNPKNVFAYSVAADGQIKVGSRFDFKLFPSMEAAIDAARNQQEGRR